MLVALKLHHTLSLTHEALKSPHMAFDQPPASLPLHTHTLTTCRTAWHLRPGVMAHCECWMLCKDQRSSY